MNFLVITKIPEHQGIFGPIAAKVGIAEKEAENLEELKNSLYIPMNAECLIVEADLVITVKSRLVNEVVDD